MNELDEADRRTAEALTRAAGDVLRVLSLFRGQDAAFDDSYQALARRVAPDDPAWQERFEALLGQVETLAPPAAAPAVPDDVLHALVDALELTGPHEDERGALHANCSGADGARAVARLARSLSSLIASDARPEPPPAPTDGHAARDAVQALVDHLALPESAQARLAGLTQKLQHSSSAEAVRQVARDVANVLVDCVAALQGELAGLNDFLVAVRARLDEVSELLVDEADDRRRTASAQRELDEGVRRRIDDMRAEVDRSEDMASLKAAIEHQIALLDDGVSGYLLAERERLAKRDTVYSALADQVMTTRQEAEQLREALAAAEERATRDPLTGLPNRAAYDDRLQQEIARLARTGGPLALAVIDLDRFKQVNDSFGHHAGDRVLKHVASAIRKHVREQDFFARFGGEEFVLLLPDTDLDGAHRLADNLRQRIDACKFTFKDSPLDVTVSVGIAAVRAGEPPTAPFERADAALYRAKAAGRNRCAVEY
ncbi:MAG: diguanylate cyclase [Gammaproteobacteria bacterium]